MNLYIHVFGAEAQYGLPPTETPPGLLSPSERKNDVDTVDASTMTVAALDNQDTPLQQQHHDDIRHSINDSTTADNVRQKELHIAPMLDVSNHEFRHLMRILSKRCILWTELVVDETLVFTDNVKGHLDFDTTTKPLICQVGGNHDEWCGKAAQLVGEFRYDGINFNMDCPSHRVAGKREFGAALMTKPKLAVKILREMKRNSSVPVSVKTRIGVDNEIDSWEDLVALIQQLRPVCNNFYIHARKCLLDGLLNPAQNRIVPPLHYPWVYDLCRTFDDCNFWINGGIPTLKHAKEICYGKPSQQDHHKHGDIPCHICNASNGSCTTPPIVAPPNLRGCMMGRAAMDNPSLFWDVDRYFYKSSQNPCRNRRQVLERYCQYLEKTYPRRCCDDDSNIITTKIPAPNVQVLRECCSVCWEFSDKDMPRPQQHKANTTRIKISSRVVDRAIKPVLGIFFQQAGSKKFKQACHALSRDFRVRNCGPAYMVRKALQSSISDQVLDQDFRPTEETNEDDVVSHVGPRCC